MFLSDTVLYDEHWGQKKVIIVGVLHNTHGIGKGILIQGSILALCTLLMGHRWTKFLQTR